MKIKLIEFIRWVKWYYRIRKIRLSGKYPVNKGHLLTLSKFMSKNKLT